MNPKQIVLLAEPIENDALPLDKVISRIQALMSVSGYSDIVTVISVPDEPEEVEDVG